MKIYSYEAKKFLEASYSVTDGNSINRHIDVHPVYIPLITSLVKKWENEEIPVKIRRTLITWYYHRAICSGT